MVHSRHWIWKIVSASDASIQLLSDCRESRKRNLALVKDAKVCIHINSTYVFISSLYDRKSYAVIIWYVSYFWIILKNIEENVSVGHRCPRRRLSPMNRKLMSDINEIRIHNTTYGAKAAYQISNQSLRRLLRNEWRKWFWDVHTYV